jgi:hypothetical protein
VDGPELKLYEVSTDFLINNAATIAKFVAYVSAMAAGIEDDWRAARERIESDLSRIHFD